MRWRWRWLTCGVLWGLFAAAFPEATSFPNDEVSLIGRAWRANQDGVFVSTGLMGTQGFPYGPLPIWIYQVLLGVSGNDLLAVQWIRSALVGGATALGLGFFFRELRMPLRWIWAFLPSPVLFIFYRSLWDNTFIVPMSAFLLGFHFRFLRTRKPAWALAAAGLIPAMLLTHLMSVAVIGPVVVQAIFRRFSDLRRCWWGLLVIFIAWGAIAFPYWSSLLGPRVRGSFNMSSALSAIWGARLVSGGYVERIFSKDFLAGLEIFQVASWAFSVFPWLGVAYVFTGSLNSRDRRSFRLSMPVILAQCVLMAALGLPSIFAHYHNVTWPVFAAMSGWFFRRKRWAPYLQTVTLALFLVLLGERVVRYGGTRTPEYGPGLGERLKVVDEMKFFRFDSKSSVEPFRSYSGSIHVLREIRRESLGSDDSLPGQVRIEYRSNDPHDAHLKVVVESPGAR